MEEILEGAPEATGFPVVAMVGDEASAKRKPERG
jgi:hypothetical protein